MSVIVRDAVRLPPAVGLKATESVHFAPAATELPQVFVWVKSPGSAPVTAILEIVRLTLPPFSRLTFSGLLLSPTGSLANVTLVELSVTIGLATPVPRSVTVCGVLVALSAIVSAPLADPASTGANTTSNVQELPAAKLLPQLLFWAKLPLTLTFEIAAGALLELVSVTVCVPLEDCTSSLPKDKLLEDKISVGDSTADWLVCPAAPPPPHANEKPAKNTVIANTVTVILRSCASMRMHHQRACYGLRDSRRRRFLVSFL